MKKVKFEKKIIELLMAMMGISYIYTYLNLLQCNHIDSGLVDIFFGTILMNGCILMVFTAFEFYDAKDCEHNIPIIRRTFNQRIII
jgi:type III secretory pathway component EscU